MHEMRTGSVRSGRDGTCRRRGAEPAAPRCPACGSAIATVPDSGPGSAQPEVRALFGLMETPPAHEAAHATGMADHFRAVDPHGAVAASRRGFYAHALAHLGLRSTAAPGRCWTLAAATAISWNAPCPRRLANRGGGRRARSRVRGAAPGFIGTRCSQGP